MKEILKKISFLTDIPDESIEKFQKYFFRRTYPPGSVIVEQEEVGDSLYIITRGRAKVCIIGEDGKEILLAVLKEGDFFGEMSVIDRKPRSASVIAIDECDLLAIDRRAFMELIREHPEISLKILTVLSERLRRADAQIESLALMDVYGRVARYLLDIAATEGVEEGGKTVINDPPKQSEIATATGTSRETVSRVMKDLQRRGYIYYEPGKKLVINEPLPESRRAQ